jgi:hypothetical protein
MAEAASNIKDHFFAFMFGANWARDIPLFLFSSFSIAILL